MNRDLIFWNVDTQYDFMRPDGKLYVPDAETIEPTLAKLTALAKNHNLRVVNTADHHNAQTAEIAADPDYVTTFPEHCMANTLGARFIEATRPEKPYVLDWDRETYDPKYVLDHRNIVLYKDAFDVFAGTPHADSILEHLQPKTAVVYGVASNVCVDYAVKGLLERGVQTYVVMDGIKGLPGLSLPNATWDELGARLVTYRSVERLVEETA